MLLQCSHCGAPLDVAAGTALAACRYCGRKNAAGGLRIVSAQTPAGWKPPPVWNPPPGWPAGNAPLRYHAGPPRWVFAVLFLPMALGLVGSIVAALITSRAQRGALSLGLPGGGSRIAVEKLAAVTTRETPEKLAEVLGVAPPTGSVAGVALPQHTLRVALDGKRFDAVTFEWDKERLDHVAEFRVELSEGSPVAKELRGRLRAVLGRRLTGSMFQWEGVFLHLSDDGRALHSDVRIEPPGDAKENRFWKPQVETLWAVVRRAVLGLPGDPSPEALRDYLGLGYPMGALARLDLEADIDASAASVASVFPGAVQQLSIDLAYKVALDHPWYGDAALEWANRKGSKLKEITLRPPPGLLKFPNQPDLFACMERAYGKARRVYEGAHVGGSRDATWDLPGGGGVRIYEHMVSIYLRDNPFSRPMPRDNFGKLIAALDACGRQAR